MAPGPEEIKFSSPLAQAFEVLKHASTRPGSIQMLCFPESGMMENISSALESLIEAEHAARGTRIELARWVAWEQSPYSPISSSITQRIDRLHALSLLAERNASVILLATTESWCQPTIPPDAYTRRGILLEVDRDAGSREDLRRTLRASGYQQTDLVEEPGQFALRGEILDLFDPAHERPFRISFFDTVPETIRTFHPGTQLTDKFGLSAGHLRIRPAEEVLFPWDRLEETLERIKEYCDHRQIPRKIRDPIFETIRSGFLPEHYRTWFPFVYDSDGRLEHHLPETVRMVFFEPEQQKIALADKKIEIKTDLERYPNPYWITPDPETLYPGLEDCLDRALKRATAVVRSATESASARVPVAFERIENRRIGEKEIREWLDDGFEIWIGTRGTSHQDRLRFLLKDLARAPGLRLLSGDPGESIEFLTHKHMILSESLFFGVFGGASKASTPLHPKFEPDETAVFQNASDLSPGDLIVHALHGVGRYTGLKALPSGNSGSGEYLLIEYSGGDKLYLPVYRLNTIQRYINPGQGAPLDKLGSGLFEKAKQRARDSAKKLAINLIELHAKRALLKGPQFDTRSDSYFEFCDRFEFTETEGQLRATQDVLSDLETGKLLDRLVCGDVGFGKTEVAMRAAFQAVQSGYQVAVLVPTTLLAFQHEQTFRRRMRDFPIRIESISRFKTRKMQSETLRDLRDGKVDILIGTHRLLSKDVGWNRLGLLIIDEEHRFGVEHKEKIKALQADTHTLTLTATPIPRTLNLAISGLKDISVIKTPPTNRQPIKTFVSGYSPELVKTAIETELSRGGQVFYLYNRVETIHHRAEEIRKLVPHARILVAHGQMSEAEIESKMIEFYQGHANILVCTTIIESGIDVPNAGTILIHRADRLGLAQLYQIRGRVGRSHRKSFAYLLTEEERALTPEARMRLDVLQRFVELGSGFQVASHDLEIRGGGNLLGGEQSGHIASVGLDLFTELLEEAIAELKGKKIDVEERHFEPEIRVPVECAIGTDLVPDPKLRLSLYRKISMADSDARIDGLRAEFLDRFGELPHETENLFSLIRLKNLLRKTGIESLSVNESLTSMGVRKTSPVEIDEVMKLHAGPKSVRDPRVRLTPESRVLFHIPFVDLKSHFFELEKLLRKIAPKAFENAGSGC